MKKIQALIISLFFLMTNNIQASFLQGPNPYSFGPQGRTVSDLRDFAKPKNMVRVLPNRPVVATDSDGNRVYYTPDGKMTLTITKGGAMSFSLGGLSKAYNSDGEFNGLTRTLRGSGLLQETRDSENRVLSYTALNGDGKVALTFDKDKNLTSTVYYDGQGAKKSYIVNEMTGGRTYYDKYERKMYETDIDGSIQKTYLYADVEYTVDESDPLRKKLKTSETGKTKYDFKDTGLPTSVRDYTHNMFSTSNGEAEINPFAYNETFFDTEGKSLYIKNADGFISREYYYKQDNKGNKIIDYHIDTLTKNKTYYDDYEKASYTVNDKDTVIARYYDGYTVNYQLEGNYAEVTKYDIDGKELYTTLKNIEYNDDGTINKVMDKDDNVWQEYHYVDYNGKKMIDYVINYKDADNDGNKTYTWYEDDKPVYVTTTEKRPTDDKSSDIIKDFSWNGDILAYTFDRKTQLTQWYNMDKELVYESFNEKIISKNIYSKGQLIGKWDAQNGSVTIYINERAWISVYTDFEPTAEMVTALISHATEIDNAIAKHEEALVLDELMESHGWKSGAAKKLLTTGNI